MRTLVLAISLQLILFDSITFAEPVNDHPIRHRHLERKTLLQPSKNITTSLLSRKSSLQTFLSSTETTAVPSENVLQKGNEIIYEKSDQRSEESLEKSSPPPLIDDGKKSFYKVRIRKNLKQSQNPKNPGNNVKQSSNFLLVENAGKLDLFSENSEQIKATKSSLENDSTFSILLKGGSDFIAKRNDLSKNGGGRTTTNSYPTSGASRGDNDPRVSNNEVNIKFPGKYGKANSPLALEEDEMLSDAPLKENTQAVFTRHNITVESPNQLIKEPPMSKVTIKSEDPQWTLSIAENSNKNNLNNTSTKIFAPVGGDALLPCRVGHLGDRQVSWIRRRDWFVLTSGDINFEHSKRFVVLHEAGSQDWTLHIKRAVKGDSGMYECQVSTGTGIISFFVKLQVVVPTAHIPGNGRSHVYRGSPFTIFCYVMKSPSAMQHVMWNHNGEVLNYQRERSDFKITTRIQRKDNEKSQEEDDDEGGADSESYVDDSEDEEFMNEFNNNLDKNIIISRLKVPLANEQHSGNYTCTAPNIKPASTLIYVTEGDKTAAVQRIDSGATSGYLVSQILLCTLIFIIIAIIK